MIIVLFMIILKYVHEKRVTTCVYRLYNISLLRLSTSWRVLAVMLQISLLDKIKYNNSIGFSWMAGSMLQAASIGGWRMSSYMWQSKITWCSSSMTLWSQKGQRRCSTGRFSYLPVSNLMGATPHLNFASAERRPRYITWVTKGSTSKICLNLL